MRRNGLAVLTALALCGISASAYAAAVGVPLGSNTIPGRVKCDGVTTTCAPDGTVSSVGAVAASVDAAGGTTVTNGTNGQVFVETAGAVAQQATTGTGNVVRATNPVIVAPNLGTPSAINLTNGTALPVAGVAGLGTGVGTALGVNVGSAGAPVLFNGAGGTPTSETLTNATGLPIAGITGLGTGVGTALGTAVSGSGGICLVTGSACSGGSSTLTPNSTATSGGAANKIFYDDGTKLQETTLTAGTCNLTVTVPGTISTTLCADAQAGASFTNFAAEAGKLVMRSNGGSAMTDTLAGIGSSANLGAGYLAGLCAVGAQDTLTITTNTYNGVSSLVIPADTCITIGDPDGVQYVGISQNYNASLLTAGTLPAGRLPAFGSGDVSFASGGGAGTVAANAVTNAKAAQMAAHTIKGNNGAGTANSADLTDAQVAAELPAFVGDSGSGGTKGLVPAPAAGDAAAGKFLSAAGGYSVPAGGGSGCNPGGANGNVLTDNGAGACSSNAAAVYNGSGNLSLGTAGSTVGSLSFKNATSGTLTVSPPTGALGTPTLTIPAATDTLVGRATTDTLTNKSIAGSEINSGTVAKANGGTAATTGAGAAGNLSLVYAICDSTHTNGGTSATAVSSGTAETVLYACKVPANSMGATGAIRYNFILTKSADTNQATYTVRFGAANNISGTSCYTTNSSSATALTVSTINNMIFNTATNAQRCQNTANIGATQGNFNANGYTATPAIDTTADAYFVITGTPGTSGEVITVVNATVELIPVAGN